MIAKYNYKDFLKCNLVSYLYFGFNIAYLSYLITIMTWGHCGHDHMVLGFTTTYAISAYHH